MELKKIIADVAKLRDELQTAITEGEHIFETADGDVPTGHLPNAAGALQMAVTNLEGHVAKAAEIKAEAEKPASE